MSNQRHHGDARSHQADSFTRNQFDWLRQVAADRDLAPAASRVAIALTRFFSREHDGLAWMAQATLASELGMSERAVRYALEALVGRSHLISALAG